MFERSKEETNKRDEQTKRQARANRILDAAAELLVRWGYKKTTMDDIARLAGVAKGTIYLHWKTREELFLTLIIREKMRVGEQIKRELANDPEGIMMHRVVRHSLLAAQHNPLFKALFTRDQEMLGEMATSSYYGTDYEGMLEPFYQLLSYLREHGLVRADYSSKEQITIMAAIQLGFLLVDQYLPEDFHVPDERKIDLAEEAIQHTFELRNPDQQEKRDIAANYEHMLQSIQEFLQKE